MSKSFVSVKIKSFNLNFIFLFKKVLKKNKYGSFKCLKNIYNIDKYLYIYDLIE